MDPANSFLLSKLKKELKERGGSGYHALQRKFRIMDDDGSKTLSKSEFKKAMKEMNFNNTDKELMSLFAAFDVDASQSISFEEFIRGLRDPLTERRTTLVHKAFEVLSSGAEFVDAASITEMYDVTQHPDFISGKKTRNEILQEFLQTFENQNEEFDGKVTREEFLNYYTNLGASIDNEDYFELMIRNAWHMSGGSGSAANTANKRVLITESDGTQKVVEIKNDLGLAADDEEDAIVRLKAQGFSNIAKVGMKDSGSEAPSSPKQKKASLIADAISGTDLGLPEPPMPSPKFKGAAGVSKGGAFHSSIGSLIKGDKTDAPPPPPKVAATQIFNPAHATLDSSGSNVDASREMPYGVSSLMTNMKEQLKSHGAHGFHGIQRKFKIMDDNGNGKLSLGEFKKGLKELNLEFTDSELRAMFGHFDFHHVGEITFEDFLQSLKDDMTPRRAALVKLAFDSLDENGNGVLEPRELMDKYDASNHPDVISGKKTENEVLKEWLSVFEVGGTVDGMVTYEEFIEYYHKLSANIDHDDYFELMVRNAWHLSGGEGQAANSANRRVLVKGQDGSERVMEIKNDIDVGADRDKIFARVRAQDAHAANINLFGGGNDGIQDDKDLYSPKKGLAGRKYVERRVDAYKSSLAPIGSAAVLAGGEPTPLPEPKSPVKEATPKKRAPLSLGEFAKTTTSRGRDVRSIVSDLRTQLASRGARGIIGLGRKFKIMDDDGSGSLNNAEFKKAMAECGLDLKASELQQLFEHFDRDNNSIDFEEFLAGVRGPLVPSRLKIVRLAFNSLDKDGSGILEPHELMDKYDTSKHPDVISGKKTSSQVLREFLETFEVGEEVDGMVTYQEFENYYTNVSISIDNDEYFELMMRNAWHISGGEGAAANSSNIRVLATDADGYERVVEVKNDLGLQRGDKEGTMQRLRKQGFNASSISFGDGGDDGISGKQNKQNKLPPAPPVATAPPSNVSSASERVKSTISRRFGSESGDSPFALNYVESNAKPAPKMKRNYEHAANKSSITF
jgi:Ca2+-binding EF-hand superfamily protein